MFKFNFVIIISILLSIIATPCSAKSLLTYFDTVVLESEGDICRESVLQSVVINPDEAIGKEAFPITDYENAPSESSLKSIMQAASTSFLQK